MGAKSTMTYYLERHLTNGMVDTIPYGASGTHEAVILGERLHAPRHPATYAQIRACDGRIIMTLPGNDKPGKETTTASKWQQLSLGL